MKTLKLNNGLVALIDDCDFDRVSQYKWYARRWLRGGWYAFRRHGASWQRLHHFILGTSDLHDHIDRNGLNNQRSNLRPCSFSQNGQNKRGWTHSSIFKGVTLHEITKRKGLKRWRSLISVNRKRIELGLFFDERKAALAYDNAAKHFFGEFAVTNQQLGLL